MAYTAMKKLIENQNNKLQIGAVTQEQYSSWKESQMNKLNVFLAKDQLTTEQYEELVGMFKTDGEAKEETDSLEF